MRNPVSGHIPYHGLGYYTKREKKEGAPLASVNKVILIGNLGKDPELKYTQSGTAVCSFNLATTEKWSDQAGKAQEKTEWHRITVWKKQAENCAKYLRKGSSAYIEGRIQTRSWDDQSGQKRYSTEIVADNVKFLGGTGGQSSSSPAPSVPDYNEMPPQDMDNIPF